MEIPTGKGLPFMDCEWESENNSGTGPCTNARFESDDEVNPGPRRIKYTMRDEKGFYDALMAEYAIPQSWIITSSLPSRHERGVPALANVSGLSCAGRAKREPRLLQAVVGRRRLRALTRIGATASEPPWVRSKRGRPAVHGLGRDRLARILGSGRLPRP